MADMKISEMTPAGTLTGAEVVPVVQSGANRRTTLSLIKDLVRETDQTLAEADADVTPVDISYLPYDLPRYGASLDGVTDDTQAVLDWLNASIAAGVPAYSTVSGTALCLTWAELDTESQVLIDAPGLVLKGPVARTDFLSCGGNVDVRRVGFDRWGAIFERSVTQTGSITYFHVSDCALTDIGNFVAIERPIADAQILNNRINGSHSGYCIRIGRSVYDEQDNWQKIRIIGNHLIDIDGTSSVAAAIIYGKELIFAENFISDVDNTSTNEAWGVYTKCRYARIVNNTIRDVQTASSSDLVGINIKGAQRGVTVGPQGFAVECIGNTIENVGVAGTRGGCIRAQTDDVLVLGNICEDGGLDGIASDEAAGSNNVQIIGNKILFTGDGTSRTGVRVATGGARQTVANNTVVNAAAAIRCQATASTSGTDYVVRGNTLEPTATGAGIVMNTASAMTRVTIEGNTVSQGSFGFRNDGGAGLITGLRIVDNNFDGTTTPISGTVPVGSYVLQNFKVNTTSGTTVSGVSLTLADESAWQIFSKVVAKQEDASNRNSYYRAALVYRDGAGSATLQGSVADLHAPIESASTWDSTIGVTGNAVRQTLVGAASTNINWSMQLEAIGG